MTEKGVRLRSTYLLMFLFCCVYFFFVILDALIQQCSQHCSCWGPFVLLSLIFGDLAYATFKLLPFWALSSLPLVLVALLHSVSLLFRRKDFFENPGWVSSLTVGIIGVPIAFGTLSLASILLGGAAFLVSVGLGDICWFSGWVDYIR